MNGNGSFFGGDWLGAFLIIAVLFNGGSGFFGGNGNVQAQINDAINNQTVQQTLQQALLSSANNNYETLQAINGQTNALMTQNYANQINVVQGFNQITSAIAQLGYQLDSCCCSIKMQLLQDKYDAAVTDRIIAENNLSNLNQTQALLAAMGRWVANPPVAAA